MTEAAQGLEQCLGIPSEIRPVLALPDITTMSLRLPHAANLMKCGEFAKYSPHFCGDYLTNSRKIFLFHVCKNVTQTISSVSLELRAGCL